MTWLWVALAGGLGSALRHLAYRGAARRGRPSPLATVLVNGSGSFAIGVLAGVSAAVLPVEVHTVLATGLLGGFTTYSTASTEVAELWRDGRYGDALGLAGGMMALCLLAAALGWWLNYTLI